VLSHEQGRHGPRSYHCHCPSDGWYGGELWFFYNWVIPLAGKLDDCGVFCVSCSEHLTYAKQNRNEWEKRGRELVGSFKAKAAAEAEETGIKLPALMMDCLAETDNDEGSLATDDITTQTDDICTEMLDDEPIGESDQSDTNYNLEVLAPA
jgi:hypothetical protein